MPNSTSNSGIRDNHRRGAVADFLKARIQPGARLSIVSAYFTIYAYDALKAQLDGIEHLDFLFGEPRFLNSLDPEKTEKKSFVIDADGLQLANLPETGCHLASVEPSRDPSHRPRSAHRNGRRFRSRHLACDHGRLRSKHSWRSMNQYYNLPPEQHATQRLVAQFNADEQLWKKLEPNRRARRKMRPRLSRKQSKALDLLEFAKARPPQDCIGRQIQP